MPSQFSSSTRPSQSLSTSSPLVIGGASHTGPVVVGIGVVGGGVGGCVGGAVAGLVA